MCGYSVVGDANLVPKSGRVAKGCGPARVVSRQSRIQTASYHAGVTMTDDETGRVWCFQCGNDYDEDVAECPECSVPTSEQAPTTAADVGDEGDDQLAYELHEWTGHGRSMLDGMLTRSDIEHAWQGATLIVREADEEAVDKAIAETEVAEMPTLDLNEPTMVYELGELEKEQHARLLRRINESGLSHAFDHRGDLWVYESDEAKVDVVFGTLDEADAAEREFGPGIEDADPAAIMSDLFVAAARLRKKPNDARGIVDFVEANSMVARMTLPYGLTREVWGTVVDQSAELAEVLDGPRDHESDDEVQEMATELHATLRSMV